MAQVVEEVLVQEFIAHSTVEAFNEAVLHGLAWSDVVPFDLAVIHELQDRVRGELGPIACWE